MASKRKNGAKGEIVDGSKIMELVGNEQVFSNFVDNKFEELDKDRDGKLSMKELEPAVADIGAGLGLPAQGTSPDSDHIYYEVLFSFFFLPNNPYFFFSLFGFLSCLENILDWNLGNIVVLCWVGVKLKHERKYAYMSLFERNYS